MMNQALASTKQHGPSLNHHYKPLANMNQLKTIIFMMNQAQTIKNQA
jgi:hypothetical protein